MFRNSRDSQPVANVTSDHECPSFANLHAHLEGKTMAAGERVCHGSTAGEPPLCVDLDGTLIVEDTLRFSLLQLLRRRPWTIFNLPFRVLQGRAAFKHSVARLVDFDPAALSYRENLIDFLRQQKAAGRRLILATAAPEIFAHAVAAHLGLFPEIIASGEKHNAKGAAKVESIQRHLNGGEFDYIGDSFADLPVFRAARRSILVEPSDKLLALANRDCRIQTVFRSS